MIEISKLIKIRFDENQMSYFVECFLHHRLIEVSSEIVTILEFYQQPQDYMKSINAIHYKLGVPETEIKEAVSILRDLDILVEKHNNKIYRDKLNEATRWASNGWGSDYFFHEYTSNTVFADYSREGNGHRLSRKLMSEYSEAHPDTNRFKQYTFSNHSISLKDPSLILEQKDALCFLDIISLVGCKKSERKIPWVGSPLIRRSVPSGGSRHPIETYLHINNESLGLYTGLYHLEFGNNKLNLIDTFPHENTDTLAKLYFTAIPIRNMYRYRESRTMRSIHMDCGHLIENNMSLLSSCGYETRLQFDESSIIEDILNINWEHENYMATVVIEGKT